eukprot:symbB.v1.2.032442.t1/scaffold3895.1/size70954/9
MQWNNWAFPVLFSIALQNFDASSLECWCALALFGALYLSRCFGRLALTYGALYLKPSTLYNLGLLDKLGWSETWSYLVGSLTILGTVQFLLVTLRLWPDVAHLTDLEKIQRDLIEAFPAEMELNLTNGVLTGNGTGPVWIDIPSLSLFDLCGGSLMFTLVTLDFGSPDLRDLGRLVTNVYYHFRDFTTLFRVFEFEVGEEVEVTVDKDSIACGVPRSLWPPPVLGRWLPAIVHDVQPSSMLSEFRYLVRISADPLQPFVSQVHEDLGLCNGAMDLQNCTCSVLPTSLRRKSQQVLIDWDIEEDVRSWSNLQRRAIFILRSKSFANLEGFSFYHGKYWSHRTTKPGKLWRRYSKKQIRSSQELQCISSFYCTSDDNETLRCSRQEAVAQFKALEQQMPYFFTLVRWKMVLPLLLFSAWFSCVVASIFFRGFQLLTFWPFAYAAYAFLRHVDTPMLSMGHSLVVVVYTGMPWVFLNCGMEMLWQMWNLGDHLHPYLQMVLEFEMRDYNILYYSWFLWSSYVVIQLRSLATLSHRRSLALVGRAGLGPNTNSNEEDSQPTCRICFAGAESGRLISPCLCSGTMRFVHIECLNMWRASSANPQSSFRCDQCQFKYSVQRALYANILRSALVLHTVTMVVFSGIVLLCAYVCYCIHWLQKGDGDNQLFSDDFVEQLSNVTGIGDEDKQELTSFITRMNEWTIFGIPFVHLMHGLTMVGLSGCNSLGFFLSQQATSDSNPLPVISALMIIAGLFRVFYSLYRFVTLLSGKVLESAESMILDIRATPELTAEGAQGSQQNSMTVD